MIRVAVLGAAGRMGSEVCRAVEADPDTQLVAAVDVSGGDGDFAAEISTNIDALSASGAEVAVDFTVAESAVKNIHWCIEHGVHAVVGTTGIDSEALDSIRTALEARREVGVFIAPNFAIGAVLMMRFASMAAQWLPDAEIIELHHSGKLDAPSGTALRTAEEITDARRASPTGAPAGAGESLAGSRGGESGGVRIHSVRLPGLVAHQEVLFGGQGQTLSIRHDSTDRTSFMPGVLMAVKRVRDHPGLTIGLDKLLNI